MTSPGDELAGQVALVTGGSRGIGRAIVLRLARAGATVVVNYRERADAAEETVALVTAAGGAAVAESFDVGDADAVRVALQNVVDRHGRLDVLVNNAGVSVDGLVMRLREADWERALRTNLTGVFHCTKAALRAMVRARYGRIVNLTSVVAEMGNAGQAAYAAAKAGVIGFTKSLAQEVAGRGVLVNAIAPGPIETPILDGLSEEWKAAKRAELPLGRFGQPEEVAPTAVLLAAEPDSNLYVGQVLGPNSGDVMP